ncbi:TRAP transporter small permease [Salisediminibacterium beveridgei]|uniref:TRAP-type transport system, small permease component, predicted N-acetylneuraminate transporter n=1 Tax=Salisediminibacterium beveridgei TaxID=632773 RepID=A0A1D7QRA2_9BACI|nr:TRAP transporter small permease [Salisediminibacterium beveridgei]AOM81534.1 TRAP-type transport system, small permease component, predicted N-acetylneuraminate transporter [Salisediminibacterium beveridgei]
MPLKILKWLDEYVEEVILVVLSMTTVVAIATQVFMRFVLGSSLAWSEELARYCFIWLVYIGISYGVKKQRHIKVDVTLLLFKNKGKIVLQMISNILFLLFALVIVYYGNDVAQRILGFGQTSPALKIPMGYIYFATVVGMSLTSIRLIQQLIKQYKALVGKESFEVKTEQQKILEEIEKEQSGSDDTKESR